MQDSGDELHVVLINGRRLQFMPHELRAFMTSRSLMLILLSIVVLIVSVDPYVFPNPVNIFGRAAFWAGAIIIYITIMVLVGAVAHSIKRMFGFRAIYMPFVDLPIVIIATIIGAYFGALFLEDGENRLGLDLMTFVRNILLSQGLQFVLTNWVFAEFLRRHRMEAEKETASSTSISPASAQVRELRSISANGRTILIDQIIYLQSKQHYVDIKTRTGLLTVRSTMKTLVGQLEDKDGVQIHRGTWVAAWALTRMTGGASKGVVHLYDGTTLPISRPRAPEVEAWFKKHNRPKDTDPDMADTETTPRRNSR